AAPGLAHRRGGTVRVLRAHPRHRCRARIRAAHRGRARRHRRRRYRSGHGRAQCRRGADRPPRSVPVPVDLQALQAAALRQRRSQSLLRPGKKADDMTRTVITYGTFDVVHIGHINLLRRARELGDRLVVGLSTDEFNSKKHKSALLNYANRKAVLEAIRYVDLVIPEASWEQKIEDVKTHGVAVFVMGDDWTGKFDFLRDACEVVYLPRTAEISRSEEHT